MRIEQHKYPDGAISTRLYDGSQLIAESMGKFTLRQMVQKKESAKKYKYGETK